MKRLYPYGQLIWRFAMGSIAQRKEARYQILSSFSKRWQLPIYQRDVIWQADPEFMARLDEFPGNAGVTAKRYNLYYLAKSVAHLDGDTAECGLASGISSYLICCATLQSNRYHHAFDSFEGLPAPEKVDTPPENNLVLKKGDYAVNFERVEKNLANFEGVRLYKGWIPERFREVEDRKFVFIHIDVDFYKATADSLSFFYYKMVPGGMILCDDYGFSGTPGAKQAFDEFLADKPEPIIKLDAGHALLIKQ